MDKPGSTAPLRRILLLATLSLASAGCTGLLLGGSGGGAAGGTRTSAQVGADDAVSDAVRRRFAADATVARQPLTVNTVNGRVILYGTLDSAAARDRAVQLARGTEGVRSVDDRIRVEPRSKAH